MGKIYQDILHRSNWRETILIGFISGGYNTIVVSSETIFVNDENITNCIRRCYPVCLYTWPYSCCTRWNELSTFPSDCPPHSQCLGDVCECTKGWTTRNVDGLWGYEQKSKWTAFRLSLLLGNFGIDWLYLMWQYWIYRRRYTQNSYWMWLLRFHMSCTCFRRWRIFKILWFVDWIRILAGAFPDGNGIPLYN